MEEPLEQRLRPFIPFGRAHRLKRYLDTYALTRQRLWQGICAAAQACLAEREPTVLIAHFPATFERLEQVVAAANIPYQISPPRVHWQWLASWIEGRPSSLLLTLAGAFEQVTHWSYPRRDAGRLAAIVVERFPHPVPDQQLIKFFKNGCATCRMGYYIALDDPIFSVPGHELLVEVMQQMGLDALSLVTSQLLTKRLDRILARRGQRLTQWHPAFSAEEWLTLNGAHR